MKMLKEKGMLRTTSRKAVSLAACFCLAASLLAFGGCAPQADDIDGEDTPLASTEEGADGSDSSSTSSSDVLTIVAGAATKGATSGSAADYTFPKLEVKSTSTKLIKSITVQFTTKIENGDAIKLTPADGFTLYGGNKTGNGSVNAAGAGATAEQWQAYLRDHLTVSLAGSGLKGLRMIASFEQVDRTLDYNSLNGHYYEYVGVAGAAKKTTVAWTQAYEAAAQKEYMGMTGYLVTVTSKAEQDFIASLIKSRTWIGATSWPSYTGDSSSHPQKAGSTTVKYYWVAGPEKGTLFASGTTSTAGALNNNAASRGLYANFTGSQPDNASGVGVEGIGGSGADKGEMHVHMYEDGTWNDYPNWPTNSSHYVQGYIIEYGDNPVDDPENGGATNVDVDVDVDVDVYVKVDINIDPLGKTITTEADDYTVGSTPAIKENVNGDPNVTTVVDGVEKPAVMTRTFYEKQPDGTWHEMTESELMDGAPYHVGDYKVVSSATYEENGTSATPYNSGEDTFTIKPKAVSLDELLTDAMSGTSLEELGGTALSGTTGDNGSDGTGTDTPSGDDSSGDTPSGGDPTNDTPEADDPSGSEAPATNPSKPTGMQLGTFGKVYDGTASFDTSRLSLEGFAIPGANVRFVCDGDATYDNNGAVGERTLTIHGVHLEGTDAADYVLKGLTGSDYVVNAVIYPRELVVTARSSVTFGLAGQPLVDADGIAAVLSSNEEVHDDPEANWEENMLAPADAERVEGGIDSILGEATITATRDTDGEALNVDDPQDGLYTVKVSFANVDGTAPAPESEAVTASIMALGDELTVVDLGDGRYDLGNYILRLVDGKVLVTDDPKADDRLGEAGEVVVDDVITREPDPAAPAMGPEDVAALIGERYGDKVPEGAVPRVLITRDGEPVGSIDPTAEGDYVIVAIYPDPEGGPDKIVRLAYGIAETSEPPVGDGVTTGPGDGASDGAGEGPGDVAVVGGLGPAADGSRGVGEGPAPRDYVVDEKVNVGLNPGDGPMDKKDIAEDLERRYGDRDGFPKGVEPEITITHIAPDGTQTAVDRIDPAVPGDYVVEAEYTMPDGSKRYVRATYMVPESAAGANGGPGGQGGGTGGDTGLVGGIPGTTQGSSGTTQSGVAGAAQSVLRLAQTGDGAALLIVGAVAVVAGLGALGAYVLRRRNQEK